MSSSAFAISSIIDQVHQALIGAQTEIVIFLLAFFIHALFFGKLKVRSKSPPRSLAKKFSGAPQQPEVRPHHSTHAKTFARLADQMCSTHDANKVASDLRARMATVPFEDTVDALTGLLEGGGKSVTSQLLAAVRVVLSERGLKPDADLAELLLRNCLALRLLGDFDQLYKEVETTCGSSPGVCGLAMRAALRGGNLDTCLERIGCLQPVWCKDYLPLVQQIVRLSLQERALRRVLERLEQLDLLHDSLDAVLSECVNRGDPADVDAVLDRRKARGYELGGAGYSALINWSNCPQEAMTLFSEGSRRKHEEVFAAAAQWALDHENEALAQSVLSNMPSNPPPDAVCKLLRYYGSSESGSAALQMYENQFRGVDLSADIDAMKTIAHAAIVDNKKTSKYTLECMLAAAPEAAKVSLLKSFASTRQLSSVLHVLRSTPDKSCCLYNAVIDACIDCNSIDDAHQVMSEAVNNGFADTITYNTILKAYLHAKKPKEARQVVDAMKDNGFSPNAITFNELLDGMVKISIQEAWPVLKDMRASGLRPNRITCAILLKAVQQHTKTADVERVMAVLNELEEDLDEVLLCSVVEACIRAGRAELLVPQLRKQKASGRIMQIKGAHTYGNIIRAYGFVGDTASVWETWREMRTRHVPANAVTLGCMTEALVANGDPEAAYDLIHEVLKDPDWKPLINAVIYCSVLKGFSHQKRVDRMWQVYKEMLALKLQFSIVTFNTLVDACSRNGQTSRIPALLEDMVAQGIAPNIITYSAIVKGYCQENRIEEAFSVVESMMQNTSLRPDEIMFNTLLDGCARQGMYDRGVGVLEAMEKSNVAATNFTLSVLVKLAGRSKKLSKAFEFCETITNKYRFRLNVHVFANLINACINNKDLDRSFEVFQQMLSERVRPDVRSYSLLLKAFVAAGQADEVSGLLRAAAGLPGAHPQLAKFDSRFLQPQGGLPSNLLAEILEGLAVQCHADERAVTLLKELRSVSHVKLDPKLQFRLATGALKR